MASGSCGGHALQLWKVEVQDLPPEQLPHVLNYDKH